MCQQKTGDQTCQSLLFWDSLVPGLLSEAEEMFKDVLEHCREALGAPWFPFDGPWSCWNRIDVPPAK